MDFSSKISLCCLRSNEKSIMSNFGSLESNGKP